MSRNITKNTHIAEKGRLVGNLIKGKSVAQAIDILRFGKKRRVKSSLKFLIPPLLMQNIIMR